MKIKLTAFARINLFVLLGSQQGTLEDLEAGFDIREKIAFDEDRRKELVVALPDGRVIPNEQRLAIEPDIEIELEKAEVKYLTSLLATWRGFGMGDFAWVRPLKAQLRAESK